MLLLNAKWAWRMATEKRLVIDASVAHAAGGRENPTSKRCTDFLEAVRQGDYRLVMTPDIFVEWQKHEAFFASTWLKSMVARKRVAFFKADDVRNDALRDQIDKLAASDRDQREMAKDVHLLEAAIITDRIISSLNTKDRDRFKSICAKVVQIANVVWVNPDAEQEGCIDWLMSGAPPDKHRQLGHIPEDKE